MTGADSPLQGNEAELDLVDRAKRRDESAWATLYDTYYPALYKFALARLGKRQDAEDVASQIFLEALKGIDSYRFVGRPILAWLYGIGRNLVAQRIRRESRQNRANDLFITDGVASGGDDSIIERLDLAKALQKLTPDQQDVIILRFFLALSIRETAQAVEKTENAVAVLQVRAIGALRRHLSDASLKKLLTKGQLP
ncbi:MAG TPA: sigma-70 family RNA polymerase sigma factor [Chroococcales cyanobacterium]